MILDDIFNFFKTLGKVLFHDSVNFIRLFWNALLEEIAEIFRFLDNPGTYLMMIVLGVIIIPFYLKSINRTLSHPEDYYAMSFDKKFFIGILLISFLILYGLYNFMRFVH